MRRTKIIHCESEKNDCSSKCQREEEYIGEIKEVFERGKLSVYPTETLYALGADPFNERAIDLVYKVKKRPKNMPISIAVADFAMMKSVAEVNELAQRICQHLLPGPVTLLLKKKDNVPDKLTFGSHKIGIRVPKHQAALRIIQTLGPITATSANLHGHPDPKNLKIAFDQLGDHVDLYLDCGQCEYQSPSTIVDVSGSSVKIIRNGVIPNEELLALASK
ncbi:MAG: threonylcarbamoyl-AMP synthase [Thermoplasmata archaeon]|nr:MAG: threonylcarbamoyl-AMP synthase [Thermoplasmata archaeon]